ncbi:MAG: hypothetical protein K6F85_01975 [Bacteroidales bacterium]|nr:hypothetical protein [Bacteroidales bacterium]
MNKKAYIQPKITVVTFAVERGYAISNPITSLFFYDEMNETTQAAESFSLRESWTNDDNNHFWD